MRLVHLELSGFGAFREHTALDFSDVDFFAMVGPTGSGKSTVIDAVCFSLYGSVPRYEDQRLNRYVVTLGSSEARVSLTFELECVTYIATRVVRRTPRGQFTTKEARLERIEADGSSTVLAGAERDMRPAVESLLKLDFEDFTRCVVLPQGEFARFLRAKGQERRDLLLRLLNLEVYLEVGRRAAQAAEVAKTATDLNRRRLSELATATRDALSAATKRAKSLEKLKQQAERARPQIEASAHLEGEERRREGEARRFVLLLQKLAIPEQARKHGALIAETRHDLANAEKTLKEVQEARENAATAADGLPDLSGLQAAASAHINLAKSASSLANATSKAKEAHDQEVEARQAVADMESKLAEATAEVNSLEIAHLAESLAEHLVVGEQCPVCLQVVGRRPSRHAPQALSKAKRAEDAAKNDLQKARDNHSNAAKRAAALDGEISSLNQQKGNLKTQLKGHPNEEKLDALITATKTKIDALAAARDDAEAAQKVCQKKRLDLEGLRGKTQVFQSQFDGQRDSVVLLGPPAAAHLDLIADWEALVEWSLLARSTQETAANNSAIEAASHHRAATEKTQMLIDTCATLDVEVTGDIVAVLTTLAQAIEKATSEVERITQDIAEAKALGTEIAELTEKAEVAGTLRGLLRADRFPEWLVAEALELLVDDASKRLRELTNEGFSLALGEREFMVIDHANADEMRPARTLSGGETFQASLALALALSDQIRSLAAEGAPFLDALFLDEGFGTLDPDTLETVAVTIENLGQSGRMVGIITHVRELAARVPVRFEVRKGARSAVVEKQAS